MRISQVNRLGTDYLSRNPAKLRVIRELQDEFLESITMSEEKADWVRKQYPDPDGDWLRSRGIIK